MLSLIEKYSFYLPILLTLLSVTTNDAHKNIEERSFSTSVTAMTELLNTERLVIEIVEIEISTLREQVFILRRFLQKIYVEHKSMKDIEEYLSNPLNVFSLMRRTHADWPYLWKTIQNSSRNCRNRTLLKNVQFPTRKDLSEAVVGMERIRTTYKLNPMDIAEGRINGVQYNCKLSAFHLFTIGFELLKLGKHDESVFWLNVSLHTRNKNLLSNEISYFDPILVYIVQMEALLVLDRKLELINLIQEAFKLYPENKIINKLQDIVPEYESEVCTESLHDASNFERCCRGACKRRTEGLHCRYNTTMSPYHLLAPPKMEELSIDPYIVLYYDVLTDDEIERLKQAARKRFTRATVLATKNSTFVSDSRTTHQAYVSLPKDIEKRLTALSGFDASGFEDTGILNYGIGGHYAVHTDYFSPYNDEMAGDFGDRIATILIYLNDVEQGGATAFPGPKLAIPPIKGSLLLWYNLKNSGKPDVNVLHGACPVIVGSKWVLNQWVREKAQFRARPCYDP